MQGEKPLAHDKGATVEMNDQARKPVVDGKGENNNSGQGHEDPVELESVVRGRCCG